MQNRPNEVDFTPVLDAFVTWQESDFGSSQSEGPFKFGRGLLDNLYLTFLQPFAICCKINSAPNNKQTSSAVADLFQELLWFTFDGVADGSRA